MRRAVLILVVMEDSLGPGNFYTVVVNTEEVLILVVMEDSLGHRGLRTALLNSKSVLILVVMEDSLGQGNKERLNREGDCLNPCCNGR